MIIRTHIVILFLFVFSTSCSFLDSKSKKKRSSDANENVTDENVTFKTGEGDQIKMGLALYEQHCSGCHGEVATSQKRGRSAEQIKIAIGGVPQMKHLSILSDEQIESIAKALNAPIEILCEDPSEPVAVGIRRLTKKEYGRTVRDLSKIDSPFEANLPQDNKGHSFSNISAILSVSPTHLEAYLEAAEDVAANLVVIGEAISTSILEAEDMQGSTGQSQGDYYNLWSNGNISQQHNFGSAGQYRITVRAYQSRAGNEDAKMQVMVNGTNGAIQNVSAESGNPQNYSGLFQVPSGNTVISVSFLNDYYQAPDDRNLYIDSVTIEGPLNTVQTDSFVTCDYRSVGVASCAFEILNPFVRKAYRRPVTASEVDEYVTFVEESITDGGSFAEGLRAAVAGVLMSPHFMFKVELLSQPDSHDAIETLSAHELANRLSYFLWGTLPDSQLSSLADSGAILNDDELRKQVQRMISSPKSDWLVKTFATEWFDLEKLDSKEWDTNSFPDFNNVLLTDMRKETETFFESFLKENKSFDDLYTADYSYINNNLSNYYDLGNGSSNFVKTQVLAGQRRGILTQGAVLAANSGTYETQPVLRGLYVLQKVTCMEPPPPPNIDTTVIGGVPGQTKKEKLAIHAKDPSCAGCHRSMDPLGFAFEQFDVVGAYRETYFGKEKVDATGKLPSGESFTNHMGLIEILKDDKQISKCMTDHVLTFSLGHEMEESDYCRLTQLTDSSKKQGFSFRTIVENIVTSSIFKKKRGQE